jgi:hypothetical protein
LTLERLKVFVVSFECWRFLLILLDVEGFYFYFLMLKFIAFILKCLKFLLLVLNVESACSYLWILKVLTFVLGCWRFLLLDVHQNYVYKIIFSQKYLKLEFNLLNCKHNIWLYL